MKSLPAKDTKVVSISQAAEILDVSIDTIRRWDKEGILHSSRDKNNVRFFSVEELEKIKFAKPLSISDAASHLGISQSTLRRLEKKGVITPSRSESGERVYSKEDMEKFLNSEYFLRQKEVEEKILEPLNHTPGEKIATSPDGHRDPRNDNGANEADIADQAVIGTVVTEHHQEITNLLNFKKMFYGSGLFILTTFIVVVTLITILFLLFPQDTAKFFGLGRSRTLASNSASGLVLGAKYPAEVLGTRTETSALGKALKPFGNVALGVVSQVSPETYEKIVPKKPIEDINDIFTIDENNNVSTYYNLTFPDSSYLVIPDKGLVKNLNAEYVQGRVPGNNEGNLVVYGKEGKIAGLKVAKADITGFSVWTSDIVDGSITALDLGIGSVASSELLDGTIVTVDLADGSITTTKLADSAVTTGKITDGTITNADISDSAAINDGKLAQITAGDKVAGSAVQLSSTGGLVNASGLSLTRTCSNGQVLTWNSTSAAWECGAGGGGSGASGDITSVTAGAGLTGGSASGDATVDVGAGSGIAVNANDVAINLTTSGTTGSNSSNSGLEVSSSGLTLLKGCSDNQILKYTDAGGWACAADNNSGGGGGSSVWSDLTAPSANLSLLNNEYTTAFAWDTASTASGFDGLTLSLTNDSASDSQTQRVLVLKDNNTTGGGATEGLLRLDHADTDSVLTDAIQIVSTGSSSITDGIDVSDPQILNALNIGPNRILGTTSTIDFDNFDVLDTGTVIIADNASYTGAQNVTFSSGGGGNLILNSSSNTLTMHSTDTSISATGLAALNSSASLSLNPNTGTTYTLGTSATSLNLFTSNTATLNFANAATALNIADAAIAGTINIGGVTANGASTINIATNGTSADSIIIGNTNASTTVAFTGGDDWNIASTGVLTLSASAAQTTALVITDTDYTNSLSIGDNNITGTTFTLSGTGATIDFSEFDVSPTTGSVTIDDGGNSGALAVEGTNLDINSLDFTGAGNLTSTADLTLDSGSNTLTIASTDTTVTAAGVSTFTLGAGVTINTSSSGAINLGDGTTTIINLVTDSTGDAEVELPTSSISSREITDNTIIGADVADDTFEFVDFSDSMTIDAATTITRTTTSNEVSLGLNLLNNGGISGTDQLFAISNALSANTSGDLNTEALLVLDQADTTSSGNSVVDDALLITNSGGSTLTDGIQIGTGTQGIVNAINIASTGVTTDISLQNGESIDNNSDGIIFLTSPAVQTSGLLLVGNGSGNDYLEFSEEAGNPTCGAGDYKIWANSSGGESKLKKCQNGALSDMDAAGAWDAITAPTGNTALDHQSFSTTFDWSSTGALSAWTFDMNNTSATATSQGLMVLNNAQVDTANTDNNTENILLLQQLDTATGDSNIVDNALKIDVAGAAGMTDAIEITNSAGNLVNGINIADTAGTFTTAILLSGTFTNLIDAPFFDVSNAGVVTLQGAQTQDITTQSNNGLTITPGGTGALTLSSANNAANAIYIRANGGISETVKIHADQSTGVASLDLLSDVGGISLTAGLATADAININASNAAGGIDIDSGTGGIIADTTGLISFDSTNAGNSNFTVNASGADLTLEALGGNGNQVIINSAGTSASAIDINATGAVAGNAITIDTTDGGIALTAAGTANGDITLTAGDDVDINGGGTTAAINIGTVATAHTITIGNDTGATGLVLRAGTGDVTIDVNLGTTDGLIITGLTANTAGEGALCRNTTTNEITTSAGGIGGNTCAAASSRRYKHDIETITTGLDFVKAMRPVSFASNQDNSLHYGFIAEEINEILGMQRAVVYKDGIVDGLHYDQFFGILAAAIKELDQKVDANALLALDGLQVLGARVDSLENRVGALESGDGSQSASGQPAYTFDNKMVILDLDGHFAIKNDKDEEVASIDEKGNATFKGTITADKIKANQIEGIEVITDKVTSLSQKVANLTAATPAPESANALDLVKLAQKSDPALAQELSTEENQVLGSQASQDTSAGSIQEDVALSEFTKATTDGTLAIDKPVEFKAKSIFSAIVEFISNVIFHGDVTFLGRPTFNKDTAGFATIKEGAKQVRITFEREYASTPVVTASSIWDIDEATLSELTQKEMYLLQKQDFIVAAVNSKGFTIVLEQAAIVDLKFSWNALAVQDGSTTLSTGEAGQAQSNAESTSQPSSATPTSAPSVSYSLSEPEASRSASLKTITVKDNELGFLRVREASNADSEEVGKVDLGQTFNVLEEENGWYKIEYTDGKTGWVSGAYVEVN